VISGRLHGFSLFDRKSLAFQDSRHAQSPGTRESTRLSANTLPLPFTTPRGPFPISDLLSLPSVSAHTHTTSTRRLVRSSANNRCPFQDSLPLSSFHKRTAHVRELTASLLNPRGAQYQNEYMVRVGRRRCILYAGFSSALNVRQNVQCQAFTHPNMACHAG